jgi:HD-like signal output (HDOD) protein
MPQIAEFIRQITLPTMPEVAHELIRSLNQEDAPLSLVRRAIAKDPALAVKLLRLANSARYGASRSISSIDDAIAMVGVGQVRTLVLASCLNNAFPVMPGLDRDRFWRSSQACGAYAHWLASRVNADSDQAWLTGFMVRLGELVMAQHIPDCLGEIEKLPQHPGCRWERENALLGFTEGQVTAELARRWQFPEAVVKALDASADPLAARPFSRLGAVLHVAELLADMEPGGEDAVAALPEEVLAALQLEPDWLRSHLPQAHSMIEDTATVH